jgi:hypothetical protein
MSEQAAVNDIVARVNATQPASETPATPAEPAWSPSREEFEQLQQDISRVGYLANQVLAGQGDDDDDYYDDELDPFDPDYEDQVHERAAALGEEIVQHQLHERLVAQGQREAEDIISRAAGAFGVNVDPARTRERANEILVHWQRTGGSSGGSSRELAEHALVAAVEEQLPGTPRDEMQLVRRIAIRQGILSRGRR